MSESTKTILGHLLLQPELLSSLEIDISFFKDSRHRITFKKLKEGISDISLISDSQEFKGDKTIFTYLSSLFDAVPKTRPENLQKIINRVKAERLKKEVTKAINDGARTGVFDHEKIKALYQKIEALETVKENYNLINLDEIEAKPIDWLWYNKIPSGKLSLLVGDPGAGKSLLSLYIASIVSRGDDWPDVKNAPGNSEGSVIMLTNEDSLADTVRIRADVMGANCPKIKILEGMISVNNQIEFFDIRKHIRTLEQAIERTGDVKLLIFDPITAYLGNIEGNQNIQVRAALAPLAALADKYKLTIIGINHLNKDQAKKALYRSMGSVAFTATARSVWLVQLDEDDPHRKRRFFSPLKANICKDPTTLAFSIDGPIGRPGITFESMPIDITAEELLADEETKDRSSALQEAKDFLIEILKNGKMPSNEIEEQAKQLNIAPATLQRARSKLRIKAYQKKGKWWTELP